MNAQELSVGNLVKAQRFNEEVLQIESISYDGEFGSFVGWHAKSGSFLTENILYLNPIPITPDSLALLGTWHEDEGLYLLESKLLKSGDVYLFHDGAKWVLTAFLREFNVGSIHHLQNILQVLYGITLSPTLP